MEAQGGGGTPSQSCSWWMARAGSGPCVPTLSGPWCWGAAGTGWGPCPPTVAPVPAGRLRASSLPPGGSTQPGESHLAEGPSEDSKGLRVAFLPATAGLAPALQVLGRTPSGLCRRGEVSEGTPSFWWVPRQPRPAPCPSLPSPGVRPAVTVHRRQVTHKQKSAWFGRLSSPDQGRLC